MKLYPYQEDAAKKLAESLKKYTGALDASDTGVGKTFTALETSRILGWIPLVICPKSVTTAWERVAEGLHIPLLDVINVEKLKTGKTPHLKRTGKNKWVWTVPAGTILIWDECQNAGGFRSQNGKILALAKAYRIPTICLSATCADSPLKLKAVGYHLGLHQYRDYYAWCLQNGCWKNDWNGLEFRKSADRLPYLNRIHRQIFPEKGVRVRIADLPQFPENAIFAEAYDLDIATPKVNEIYHNLREELKKPENAGSALTCMLRARQAVELLKVPLLEELTNEAIEEGKSVVAFLSFRETLVSLERIYPNSVAIFGDQNQSEREESIRKFQTNAAQICLCMVQAGGVGVSLQDLDGAHPRVSFITPTFSAVEIKQALGRIHRINGKSKCVQKILFAANTVEESACEAVKRKLANIDQLNDGDFAEGVI